VFLDILPFYDGKGLHDIIHIVAAKAVEVKKSSGHLAADEEAPFLVPAKRRAVIAAVPGSVGKFKDAREEPSLKVLPFIPRRWMQMNLLYFFSALSASS
jgi:hypothetical protein